MIRYRITLEHLRERMEKECPGWLKKAELRTAKFRKAKQYVKEKPIWSEVKPVYMKLQGDCKCAFCERKMEAVTYGKGEQDVEHFRPKSSIKAWKAPEALAKRGVAIAAVPKGEKGYYLLPYHPFNYTAACKPCNSALKSNYFPVAKKHHCAGADPKALLEEEQPLLIYPIGDFDEDPENLIRFYGASPYAVKRSGHGRKRALVTIEFFKLDAADARNLFRERAEIIRALYRELDDAATLKGMKKKAAMEMIKAYTSSTHQHANCARSFMRLYQENPAEAEEVYNHVREFIRTKEPK